jgi:hypothetical protein
LHRARLSVVARAAGPAREPGRGLRRDGSDFDVLQSRQKALQLSGNWVRSLGRLANWGAPGGGGAAQSRRVCVCASATSRHRLGPSIGSSSSLCPRRRTRRRGMCRLRGCLPSSLMPTSSSCSRCKPRCGGFPAYSFAPPALSQGSTLCHDVDGMQQLCSLSTLLSLVIFFFEKFVDGTQRCLLVVHKLLSLFISLFLLAVPKLLRALKAVHGSLSSMRKLANGWSHRPEATACCSPGWGSPFSSPSSCTLGHGVLAFCMQHVQDCTHAADGRRDNDALLPRWTRSL